MIRPVALVAWAAVAVLVGTAALAGRVGFGAAALLEAIAACWWAVLLTRSDDGRP